MKTYKLKNAAFKFLCAFCSTPREIKANKNLSLKTYFRLIFASLFIVWLLFPFLEVKSFLVIPILWFLVELFHKMLFRNELKCPHCGFDAVWYAKNVNVARQKVKDYWELNKKQ